MEVEEEYPEFCASGHRLIGRPFEGRTWRPNGMIVGWDPCACPEAAAHRGGHRYVLCDYRARPADPPCEAIWRTPACTDPSKRLGPGANAPGRTENAT